MAQCAKYCKDIVTDELGGGSPPIPFLARCLLPEGCLTGEHSDACHREFFVSGFQQFAQSLILTGPLGPPELAGPPEKPHLCMPASLASHQAAPRPRC